LSLDKQIQKNYHQFRRDGVIKADITYLIGGNIGRMEVIIIPLIVIFVYVCMKFLFGILWVIFGLPIAILLAWTSVYIRTLIAGFISTCLGIVTIEASVYYIYKTIFEADVFPIGPFIATLLPIFYFAWNDYNFSKNTADQYVQLLETSESPRVVELLEKEIPSNYSISAGYMAGAIIVIVWYVLTRGNLFNISALTNL